MPRRCVPWKSILEQSDLLYQWLFAQWSDTFLKKVLAARHMHKDAMRAIEHLTTTKAVANVLLKKWSYGPNHNICVELRRKESICGKKVEKIIGFKMKIRWLPSLPSASYASDNDYMACTHKIKNVLITRTRTSRSRVCLLALSWWCVESYVKRQV